MHTCKATLQDLRISMTERNLVMHASLQCVQKPLMSMYVEVEISKLFNSYELSEVIFSSGINCSIGGGSSSSSTNSDSSYCNSAQSSSGYRKSCFRFHLVTTPISNIYDSASRPTFYTAGNLTRLHDDHCFAWRFTVKLPAGNYLDRCDGVDGFTLTYASSVCNTTDRKSVV